MVRGPSGDQFGQTSSDKIGQHEVLLPIDKNYDKIKKKTKHK